MINCKNFLTKLLQILLKYLSLVMDYLQRKIDKQRKLGIPLKHKFHSKKYQHKNKIPVSTSCETRQTA